MYPGTVLGLEDTKMNKIEGLPLHLEDCDLNWMPLCGSPPLNGKLGENRDGALLVFTILSPACSTVEGILWKSMLNKNMKRTLPYCLV